MRSIQRFYMIFPQDRDFKEKFVENLPSKVLHDNVFYKLGVRKLDIVTNAIRFPDNYISHKNILDYIVYLKNLIHQTFFITVGLNNNLEKKEGNRVCDQNRWIKIII